MSYHKQTIVLSTVLTLLAAWGCSQPPGDSPGAPGEPVAQVTELKSEESRPAAPSRPAPEPVDPVVQALIDSLFDADGTVRKQSAEGLRKRGDKAAVPALIQRVADDRWISPPRFRGTNNASDPEAGGKTAALEALKELAPDKVTEALRQAQKSKNAQVRAWAARELNNQ